MSKYSSVLVYAFLLEWPDNNIVKLGAPEPSNKTVVYLVGYPDPIPWKAGPNGGIQLYNHSKHSSPSDALHVGLGFQID